MLTVEEALSQLLKTVRPICGDEKVALSDANGRVLAETQYSRIRVPNADNSAMDGYAFRFADVVDPDTVLTVRQRIPAGSHGEKLKKGEAARIFTGAPLPEGADTVQRQEWCRVDGEQLKLLRFPEKGGSVRLAGEDIHTGDAVLKCGTFLQARHLGLAAAIGLADLPVVRKPEVALMSTGNELVMPGTGKPLAPGRVYNSNRYMLKALLDDFGCVVSDYGIVPDKLSSTCSVFSEAASTHDLILTSGGVSVGEEDHVRNAIAATGKLHFREVAVTPGKPLVFGEVASGLTGKTVPVIGLPGNPVSSFVTFLIFVRPYLLKMQKVKNVVPRSFRVKAAFSWNKPDERNEFLRARLNEEGEAELFDRQGSGVLSSLVWGDGLVDNPPGRSIAKGDRVRFLPFNGFFCP